MYANKEDNCRASWKLEWIERGESFMTFPKRMLIADNVKMNRAILAELFQEEFEIIEAEDGEEALQILHDCGDRISIAILDLFLPKLDGFGILRAMAEDPILRTIPALVTSGEDEIKYGLAAIELGASDYIIRPIDPRLVELRVRAAISKRENDQLRAQNAYLLLQKEEKERYRDVLRSTHTIVLEYDLGNGQFRYDSLANAYLSGVYDHRPLPQILLEDKVSSEEDAKRVEAFFEQLLKDPGANTAQIMVKLRNQAGMPRWFRINGMKKVGENGKVTKLLATMNDVHEEVVLHDRLLYLAQYDPLTGLYNKTAFILMARELVQNDAGHTYVLARFDIEKFKLINDMYGHKEGDRLLCYVAKQARAFIKRQGGICGRMEGDVFAICMPYAKEKIDKLLERSTAKMKAYDLPFEVILCFGFYIIDDPKVPMELILDRAGMAQRQVKGNYVNRYAFYDETLRLAMLEEQEITGQMNFALEHGQFDIYLQPKCRLDTGLVTGAEALVRWFHPEKGMLLPGKFIPIFEKNGFILRLDAFVWERACQVIRGWLDQGVQPLPISVNLSRSNIYNPNLVQTLVSLPKKYKIPTWLLELEITESAYMDNPKLLKETIDALRSHGFTVLMDDFGSGYSSLNLLKEITVNTLKIDMQFLEGRDELGKGGNILTSVVQMARRLKLAVIVEGVETKEQAAFLKSIGCQDAQGYYFYKPMPVEEFEALRQKSKMTPVSGNVPRDKIDIDRLLRFDSSMNLLWNSVVDGMCICEVWEDGKIDILRVNDACLELTGTNLEQFSKEEENIPNRVWGEDWPKVREMFHKAASSGGTARCKVRGRRWDGSWVYLVARARLLAGEKGHAYYCVGLQKDEEQENAQLALQMEELSEHFQMVLQNTSISTWTYDLTYKRIYQAAQSKRSFGCALVIYDAPEALIANETVHRDSAGAFRAMHERISQGEPFAEGVFPIREPDKSDYRYKHIRYQTVYDKEGRPVRAIGMSEDVTDPYKLEQQLQGELEFSQPLP